jgi:TraM recognition site of TraD and TraG/Helicase HerA, central domain
MPPNTFPQEAVDPRATADRLAHWLTAAGVHCAVGLALGAFAARAMRRRHLHWSWATGALALVLVAGPGLGGWTFSAGLAAAIASVRGRRWHREDLDAGADLAEIAARRSRPPDVVCSLARIVALRARRRLLAADRAGRCVRALACRLRRRELPLGLDERNRGVWVPCGGEGGGTHTLVVGATGSGKTVTQTWISAGAIERGMGAVVIDPKGDRALREELRRSALRAGRPFVEWTPDGDSVYNPYARGGASEIADKALAGERFTEPHYLRQAQRYLGHAVRALRDTGTEVSLHTIVEQLEPGRLELLARELPEAQAHATFAYLDSLSARQRGELAGVRDRLAILAESDVGRWLDPRTAGVERIDLLEEVRRRAVVCFGLQSDSRPLLSEMLGAAIVQDLQTVVASLQATPQATLVVIDEFSAIAAEHVVRLFGRARSAGFSLLLGTQELADLRLPGRERLLDQVLGNLSALIAHRQVVPSSAELIASLAGTRGGWRVSRHSNGGTTRVRTREQLLTADRVTGLGSGWAVVLRLDRGGLPRIARVFSPAHRRR